MIFLVFGTVYVNKFVFLVFRRKVSVFQRTFSKLLYCDDLPPRIPWIVQSFLLSTSDSRLHPPRSSLLIDDTLGGSVTPSLKKQNHSITGCKDFRCILVYLANKIDVNRHCAFVLIDFALIILNLRCIHFIEKSY